MRNIQYLGDVGTEIQLTVVDHDRQPADLSASEVTMVFIKPSGKQARVTPAFVTDGRDGAVRYIIDGDLVKLDEQGVWRIRLIIETDPYRWTTSHFRFVVKE